MFRRVVGRMAGQEVCCRTAYNSSTYAGSVNSFSREEKNGGKPIITMLRSLGAADMANLTMAFLPRLDNLWASILRSHLSRNIV